MAERRAFSVSVLARNGGKVLVIKHRRLERWLPVGGEVEPGETPLEAARRELCEETGLIGTFRAADGSGLVGEPAGLIGYEEHEAGSKGTHLNFCFVADVPTQEVAPNDEFGEWRWVSEAAALECPPNVKTLIERALRRGQSPLIDLARAWLSAFNRRDLEALLALYAENAVHFSPKLLAQKPETRGHIKGQSRLRAWWQDCFERLPGLKYTERSLTADGKRVFMEYVRDCPGQDRMDVAEVLRCKDGRIVESRVYHG